MYGDDEELVELVSVNTRGVDITSWVNSSYIFDLISDEISNADCHHSDHGDDV